ncbi:mycofactocin-coupled SDR family oxidoreductase [Williamsia deligens]
MSTMTGRFDGAVVYITGIARGQGRNHAVRFAQEGAAVIGMDIAGPIADHTTYPAATPEDLDETIRLVEEAGGSILARQGDTRDLEFQERLVADGVERFGRLDHVIANAGVLTWGRIWELTPEQFDDVMAVNVRGTWNTLRVTIPVMIEHGIRGSITVVSSSAGLKAMPFQASYSASKFAIRGMAQSAAKELGEQGIRVNTIHPYAVNTPMAFEDTKASEVFAMERFMPNFVPILDKPFFSTCDEVTDMVMFLCSDSAKTITASEFSMDQGSVKV